jgi:gas vesicle protein
MAVGDNVFERVHAFFERQARVLEEMLRDFAPFSADASHEEIATLSGQQQRHVQALGKFQEEMERLAREWRAADVTDQQRQQVRALARRVEELTARIIKHCEQAAHASSAKAQEVATQIKRMRTGKQNIQHYKTDATRDPRFIDEKT